ncbi:MAG: hypothetical protein JKY95_00150 [Planctomycetaceae bacterium]|nr:hypothetical protein [Planctomycetaceae bacterium]
MIICLSRGIDFELWCVDGTVIRSHRVASGALKGELSSEENAEKQALERSRGGYSTKLHLLTDGQGIPLAVTATPGQRNEAPDIENVIPTRSNETRDETFDTIKYKKRNIIEREDAYSRTGNYDVDSMLGKKEQTAARIALILHLAKRAELFLQHHEESFIAAETMSEARAIGRCYRSLSGHRPRLSGKRWFLQGIPTLAWRSLSPDIFSQKFLKKRGCCFPL